jgi:hypothetical protein
MAVAFDEMTGTGGNQPAYSELARWLEIRPTS